MTDLTAVLRELDRVEEEVRDVRRDVGLRLSRAMNDVTTGDGWHALDTGAVLFAPGCEIQVRVGDGNVLHATVVRGGQHTHLHEGRSEPKLLMTCLRQTVNATVRGEVYGSPLLHDQPWLTVFAFWLNGYVDQVEGKGMYAEVTP